MNLPQDLYPLIVIIPVNKPRMRKSVLQERVEPVLDIQQHISDITPATNSKSSVDA